MLILKHNALSVEDLFTIERQLLRWLDNKEINIGLDFNVLSLGRTDIYGQLLGIFTRMGCIDILNITHSDLLDFFIDVDAAYLNAPYHSFYHAVDIVFMIYYMLTDLDAKHFIPSLDIAALLIAALCHDIGHPGYNNVYQINFETDLAKIYNNTSVLEAFSADMTRSLILKKHVNLVNNLSSHREDWISKIETLIMHTDMVHHYILQEQAGLLEEMIYRYCSEYADSSMINEGDDYFQLGIQQQQKPLPIFSSPSSSSETVSSEWLNKVNQSISPQYYSSNKSLLTDQQCQQLSCILLHAADISNTVRPWNISKQWSDLIVQEFFRQGDMEKQHGLAVSPGMDRDLSTQPDISLTFGDLVVKPYFEQLANLLPGAQIFLDCLDKNRNEWIRIKQSESKDGLIQLLHSDDPLLQQRQFPISLLPLPETAIQPNIERRVSVAAGTLVIPKNVNYNNNNNNKSSSRYGLRSYSFAMERTNIARKMSHGPLL
ncbi:uncharacterized protein BX664DRAFT_265002 [Halteromyces radiatus]|uniref:uncharacterized protein n=1 Tax=Halteromyces radiatus TaxID=101107 RepID=UPI00221EF1A2|nr:uncharacterized protein BX664DRAFT_265002 [Halteromyces radiatus]KAI8085994.1 hypothetical protein BX664DRAFT_265002 [Halteromyces radiatus]